MERRKSKRELIREIEKYDTNLDVSSLGRTNVYNLQAIRDLLRTNKDNEKT